MIQDFDFLSVEDVILIHSDQIREYGGDEGIRDARLLDSAIENARTTFDGRLLHADIYSIASAYIFHLCQNHPFIDGNKRTALVSGLVFLELNGVEIIDPDEKLYDLMMRVAASQSSKVEIESVLRKLAL